MRKRRPQPAIARSGQAGAKALTIASMISWPQWLVHRVSGSPSSAHTIVPGLAISSLGRKVPSFFGVSGSIRNDSATTTAEYVLAYEELTKLCTSACDSDRSLLRSLPAL